MNTHIGEYLVGAYLKEIKKCNFVNYNVRPPGGGLEGLNELDVVGLDLKNKIAYLCEVTTHIRGILYKNNETTVERIKAKYQRQKEYAKKHLPGFPGNRVIFMFWSPVVPVGYITRELEKLEKIERLELIINQKYTECIEELKEEAKSTHATANPAFRLLQILQHMKKSEQS